MKKIRTNQHLKFLAVKNVARLSMVGDQWSSVEVITRIDGGRLQKMKTSSKDVSTLHHRSWFASMRRRDS